MGTKSEKADLSTAEAVDSIVTLVAACADAVSRELKRGTAQAALLERFVIDLATALGMVEEGAVVVEVDPLAVLAAAVERISTSSSAADARCECGEGDEFDGHLLGCPKQARTDAANG
jgi:hypothetical protein